MSEKLKKPSRKAAGARKKASKAVLQAKQPPPAPVAQSEPQPPSPPQRTPEPDPYEPYVVCTVTHRKVDEEERRLGHVGVVQRRHPDKLKLNGGKPFASWACLTRDGIPNHYPERFDTFDTEAEAIAHAEYAASRKPRLR